MEATLKDTSRIVKDQLHIFLEDEDIPFDTSCAQTFSSNWVSLVKQLTLTRDHPKIIISAFPLLRKI